MTMFKTFTTTGMNQTKNKKPIEIKGFRDFLFQNLLKNRAGDGIRIDF